MPMDANRRRRWLGAVCLSLAAGMTLVGTTTLEPRLRGWWFVLYWVVCLGLLALAVGVALLDWWIIRLRRRLEEERLQREFLAAARRSAADTHPQARGRDGEELPRPARGNRPAEGRPAED
ncbi:MAG: hypothetical protein D6766_07970 [Verrucomicrobia bacterium]|nr:MAG: hypothetical protein D6766_07970 [Verrucomicrobiota bacterium]